jgi:2-oxoglutarate dehydrogenase E1 component
LAALEKGKFQELIDDSSAKSTDVSKVVICSGKLYYDLLEAKQEKKANDVALIRLEQLYPFPQKQVDAILAKYKKAKRIVWAQEEPENMGAWTYILRTLRNCEIVPVCRAESGSPATGSSKRHALEQKQLIDQVFSV